jgi:hypothetical protein
MKCSQLKIDLLIFGINPCWVSIFLKTEAGILKTFIAIAFKKISYPLSTISYP